MRTANQSAYDIALKAMNGDNKSIEIYNLYEFHISVLIKIILLILDPQAIIFGGSIVKLFELFRDTMIKNLKDFPYSKTIEKIKILTSDLNNIGVLGAGALCIE